VEHSEAVSESPPPRPFKALSDKERTQMLSVQRRKIDAATEYMRGDFSSRHFIMPDEMAIP
jgi:hypothetical protein